MNFFKALFSINSLRKEVEHLRQVNVDSAMYHLQLAAQMEQQRREIQSFQDKLSGTKDAPAPTMTPARKYYKRKPKTVQQ